MAANPDKALAHFSLNDINIKYEKKQEVTGPFDFSPLEDRVFARGLFKFTYGFWDLIRNDIRNCSGLMLNWAA